MLNKEQQLAVSQINGPVMCLAGPGAGKTHTIIQHILFLIRSQINPANILVITFSKAAAKELQTRFYEQVGNEFYPVTFGTFHSVFFQIINSVHHYSVKNILTLSRKKTYLKIAYANLNFNDKLSEEQCEDILQYIAKRKNSLFATDVSINDDREPLFQEYCKVCKENRQIDFEDMIVLCYELLTSDKDVRKFFQNQYQHIIVDESQDMNIAQYEILKILAKPQDNIMLVGDDDQSIYGFRGAMPQILSKFESDFPNLKKIIFHQNYRSTKEIVNFSHKIIQNNKYRFEKEYFTENETGNPVSILSFDNKEEEYQYLLHQIKEKSALYSYDRVACLFRTNLDAAYLQSLLVKENIPCVMKELNWNPYHHFIWKDIWHYLRLAKGIGDLQDFYAIMNKPLRYFSRAALSEKDIDFNKLYLFYRHKSYMKTIIDKFIYDLNQIKRMDFYSGINYIRKVVGYDAFLKEMAYEEKKPVSEYMDIADLLQNSIKSFDTLSEIENHINLYEKSISGQNERKNGVHITTFHGAKGLEFDCVIIPDCNEGIIPHRRSMCDNEIEEERRMFYVAVTRAKKELLITYVKGSHDSKSFVSRFIKEVIK